jgi:glycopeptide antibiotics resistance protein
MVCLIPSSGKVPTYQHLDKFFHFFGYALLAFCYTQLWNKHKLQGLFLILLIYGFFIEVLQLITGWRTFDLWDILANGMGILYGIIFSISLGKDFFKLLENYNDK